MGNKKYLSFVIVIVKLDVNRKEGQPGWALGPEWTTGESGEREEPWPLSPDSPVDYKVTWAL